MSTRETNHTNEKSEKEKRFIQKKKRKTSIERIDLNNTNIGKAEELRSALVFSVILFSVLYQRGSKGKRL